MMNKSKLMLAGAIAAVMMSTTAMAAPATQPCPNTTTLTNALKSLNLNTTQIQQLTQQNGSNLLNQLLAKYPSLASKLKTGVPTTTTTPCPKAATSATPTVKSTTPAATPTVKPTTAPTAAPATNSSVSMSAQEQQMVNLVNQDRAANGLPALKVDASLRANALKHSQDMSANNYFSHTSPTRGSYNERLSASGIRYMSAGENIAMYGSVEKAEVGFMNSPGHRANILNANYTHIGIGIVWNESKGSYYITQWFAKLQ